MLAKNFGQSKKTFPDSVTLQLSVEKSLAVPLGTDDNSPAIHRRVERASDIFSAVGTDEKAGLRIFARPSGTSRKIKRGGFALECPGINPWAIFESPDRDKKKLPGEGWLLCPPRITEGFPDSRLSFDPFV